MLGGFESVAPFVTVNKQSESNPDYSFHSSIAFLLPGDHITRILFTHITRIYFDTFAESELSVFNKCSYVTKKIKVLIRRRAERAASDHSPLFMSLHKPGFPR